MYIHTYLHTYIHTYIYIYIYIYIHTYICIYIYTPVFFHRWIFLYSGNIIQYLNEYIPNWYIHGFQYDTFSDFFGGSSKTMFWQMFVVLFVVLASVLGICSCSKLQSNSLLKKKLIFFEVLRGILIEEPVLTRLYAYQFSWQLQKTWKQKRSICLVINYKTNQNDMFDMSFSRTRTRCKKKDHDSSPYVFSRKFSRQQPSKKIKQNNLYCFPFFWPPTFAPPASKKIMLKKNILFFFRCWPPIFPPPAFQKLY